MRFDRVLAIAIRDLRIEFAGRRGWLLPFIAGIILMPMATAPAVTDAPLKNAALSVSGDAPQAVLDIDRISYSETQVGLHFVREADGRVVLQGDYVPPDVRVALESTNDGARTEVIERYVVRAPNRSLFLALIAASILTGAISQSIPGERTNQTLQGLLSAAVSREELVTGKWLAWGGFGALAASAAIAVSLVLGRQELGWWVLPAPLVSMGTVAVGFYLVRRANDVVGGATVAIRVLPAALTGTGIVAFLLGMYHPLYGAMLPLGGALVAAGDTWPGALPPIVAAASTLAMTAVMLKATARDIVDGERAADDRTLRGALVAVGLASVAWWGGIVGALLWMAGGNDALSEALGRPKGVAAGTLAIALLVLVRAGRALRPLDTLGWRRPPAAAALPAVLVTAALCVVGSVAGLMPPPDGALLLEARTRFDAALQPAFVGLPLAVVAIVAQETLFRGLLRDQLGDVAQVLAFTLVFTPLNPLHGLAVGALCTVLTRAADGSVLPAIAARVVWAVVPAVVLPPLWGLCAAVVAILAVVATTRAPAVQHAGA